MACVQDGAVTVCFTGSTEVIHRESEGAKWCFACRKRTEFEFTVTSETGMSYYDPWPMIRCTECRQIDGDLGFGRYREWGDE